jgi:hypothetical protein
MHIPSPHTSLPLPVSPRVVNFFCIGANPKKTVFRPTTSNSFGIIQFRFIFEGNASKIERWDSLAKTPCVFHHYKHKETGPMTFGLILFSFAGAGLFWLMLQEVRVWLVARRKGKETPEGNRRLVRRLGSGLLIVLAIAVIFWPVDFITPNVLKVKVSVSLSLCFFAFWAALHDFRVMARTLEREVDDFTSQSARELQDSLKNLMQHQAHPGASPESQSVREGDKGVPNGKAR